MQKTRFALGLILMFALADDAQAQRIGGLIKKTVDKATKPKEATPPTKEAAPEPSLFSFEPNADAMASFKRGLDIEIKARNEYRSELAKLKTEEQYEACQQSMIMSPEGIKLSEEMVARTDKAKTPEDFQKLSAWQVESYETLAMKQCGADPRKLDEQRRTIFDNASKVAAKEVGKGWKGKAPLSDETILRDYNVLKELAAKFCSLPADLRQEAQENGIRVAGSGSNVFWVFPAGFTQWVGPECDDLIKRDKMLEGSSTN